MAPSGSPRRSCPRYLRRTKSLEDLLPWQSPTGISRGDFSEALAALLGTQAPGLSASTITRLKEVRQDELERRQRRDLTAKRYVHFWVDGIYFGARMAEKPCILVVIGATDTGDRRNRSPSPTATAKASGPGWRCCSTSRGVALKWVRNWRSVTARSVSGWRSAGSTGTPASYGRTYLFDGCTRRATSRTSCPRACRRRPRATCRRSGWPRPGSRRKNAFDSFLEAYRPKYDQATACLAKDRDALLTFYDVPAEHWKHIRTTNPIESRFATLRLRTYRTKGCLSHKTAMAMVFKPCQSARTKWK